MQALGNLGIAIVFLVVAAVVSPVLTGAVLVFGGLTALIYRHVGKKAQALSRDISGVSARMSESATDLLTNAKFYRSTGLDGRALEIVDGQFAEWATSYGRVQRYVPTSRLAFDATGLAFIGVVLSLSLFVLDSSIAGPLVFLALFYRLAPRLRPRSRGTCKRDAGRLVVHVEGAVRGRARRRRRARGDAPVRQVRRASSSTP